jgi:hypothetical protein
MGWCHNASSLEEARRDNSRWREMNENQVQTPTSLLTTMEAARYIGVGKGFLEIRRTKDWPTDPSRRGPAFLRVGGRSIRYRVSDLNQWLAECRCGEIIPDRSKRALLQLNCSYCDSNPPEPETAASSCTECWCEFWPHPDDTCAICERCDLCPDCLEMHEVACNG